MDAKNDAASNPNRIEHLPAVGETESRVDNLPLDTAEERDATAPYDDDRMNDDAISDPITEELNERPADELGIPESEYKAELDKYGTDELEHDDDARETIEDRDEDDDSPASQAA